MADADKNIRITTSKNKPSPAKPQIVFTGASAGASVITLEVLDDNTLSFTSNEGQVFSLDSNLTVGTIWSVNDVSAIPLLRASAGGTIGIAEYPTQTVGIGTQNPFLSHKLTVRGGAAFGTSVDTGIQFALNANAVKGSNSFEARFGNEIRSYRLDDTNYVGFKASASNVQNRIYTFPTNFPGTGASYLQSDTAGTLIWVAPAAGGSGTVTSISVGVGLTTATLGPITTTGHIRALRPLVVSFCAGYTPVTSGADAVVIRIPDSPEDGLQPLTYRPEEFHVRVETPSAGTSTIQIDKSSGLGAFSAIAVTSISIAGAGIYETSTIAFSTAGTFLTSGDKLRLNFTALNSTHAAFSIYLELQEV
jgi:hypothetical protein